MPVEGGRADQRSTDVPGQVVSRGPATDAERSTSDRFERVLITLCLNARGDVHLDLAELQFVDGAGVTALVKAADSLTPPFRLILHNPPAAVLHTLELTSPDHAGHRIELR